MRFSQCLLLSTALFATSPALADDGEPIIVTATRTEQPLSRVGQSVYVLESDTILQSQKTTVADLLATTPGVTISRSGGIGAPTSVRIRGAEAEQTVALIDGVKLNDPSSGGGGFDFGNLLIGNIERIEVLRGPQSVLWGSQAIGGVINMITTDPTEAFRTNARAEYGYRNTAQFVGNISGKSGIFDGSLGAGYFRTDGISKLSEDRGATEKDGYKNFGANGKVRLHLTEALKVDLRGWYSYGRNEYDGFGVDSAEFSKTKELVGYAGVTWDLLEGRFRNRLAYAYTRTTRDNFDPAQSTEPSFEGEGTNERVEYQGIANISDGWQFTFGAERERSELFTLSAPSSFNPNPRPTRGSAVLESLYGQLIATPSQRLTITSGVRYDHHDSFGSETTLGASVAWSPNEGETLVRASYGEGFKAPTLYQLQGDFGNPGLRPERAKGWDAGVTQKLLDGKIEVSATWFERRTSDLIDFVSCLNSHPLCADGRFGYYENVSRTRAKGLEFLLSLKPVESLTLDAQYSYTDAMNQVTEEKLPRRPEHVVSMRMDYRWPFGLSTGATVTHAGSSEDIDFGVFPEETVKLGGYVLVDLRTSYRLTDNLELYGRLENLFDERYETALNFGSPGRAGYIGVRLSY